jgi:prepilin-type N-terminal cleavage/methylation domain-containing protein
MKAFRQPEQGFTILEMLMAIAIFLIICAAMFELLNLSQKKYSSETQLTAAYQDARLALDQIVRDVNASGFPPADLYSVVPSSPQSFAISPVAWSPGYTASPEPIPCLIGTAGGGNCQTPGDYGPSHIDSVSRRGYKDERRPLYDSPKFWSAGGIFGQRDE